MYLVQSALMHSCTSCERSSSSTVPAFWSVSPSCYVEAFLSANLNRNCSSQSGMSKTTQVVALQTICNNHLNISFFDVIVNQLFFGPHQTSNGCSPFKHNSAWPQFSSKRLSDNVAAFYFLTSIFVRPTSNFHRNLKFNFSFN